jgi:hypothetical protein
LTVLFFFVLFPALAFVVIVLTALAMASKAWIHNWQEFLLL